MATAAGCGLRVSLRLPSRLTLISPSPSPSPTPSSHPDSHRAPSLPPLLASSRRAVWGEHDALSQTTNSGVLPAMQRSCLLLLSVQALRAGAALAPARVQSARPRCRRLEQQMTIQVIIPPPPTTHCHYPLPRLPRVAQSIGDTSRFVSPDRSLHPSPSADGLCAHLRRLGSPCASGSLALYCPVLPLPCIAALLPCCPVVLLAWRPAALSPRKRTSATAVSTPSHALVCGGVASCRDVRLAADWNWTGGGLLLPRDSDTMDRGLRRL
jgi:hypothetical protein